MKRKASERVVTRAEATEWLSRVDVEAQRSLNVDVAKRYAADMDAGKWAAGVAVIAFDRKGRLINGQHVLNGLLLSKQKTLTVILSLNHELSAYAGFDKNRKRSAKDDLKTMGIERANEVASVATVIWQWERGVFRGISYSSARSGADFPTAAQVCEVVRTHPGIETHLYKNPFRGKGYSIGALRAASYILHKIDEKNAKAFFHSLVEGVGIPASDHPIALLRNRILRLGVGERLRTGETLAYIFKAWKAYISGESLSGPLLRKGEPFPDVSRA